MNKSTIVRKVNNGIPYFVKYYQYNHILKKVQFIHQQLQLIEFPFVIPLEKVEENNIVQRWFDNSRTANYTDKEDRIQVYRLIQAFHETNEKISWSTFNHIPSISLKAKWRNRIKSFQTVLKNNSIMEKQIGEMILNDAISTYKKIDLEQSNFQTLCHGDVVHHNFMKTEDGWKIIDFDLSYLGNPENELLYWIMRVLPFMKYDLNRLLEELPDLQKLQNKLSFVAFPNEVMREAIYYAKLNESEQRRFRPFFQQFLENALKHRQEVKHIARFYDFK